MDSQSIQNYINPYISDIMTAFQQRSGQFMIVGPDTTILDYVVNLVCKKSQLVLAEQFSCKYKAVFVTKNKDFSPDKKIFVLNLELSSSIEYQSLLYYYLELPLDYECFVCLVSSSSQSINMFEKRVMSRFKNKIFFIPCYNLEIENELFCGKVDSSKQSGNIKNNKLDTNKKQIKNFDYSRLSSLTTDDVQLIIKNTNSAKKSMQLMQKYDFLKFSTSFILDLLQPIHFVLLTISFDQKLNSKNFYNQFRKAVVNTPEIKKTDPSRVLYCFFDLIDCKLISSSGNIMIDSCEFRQYVAKNCPLFIKKLVQNYSKLIK